MMEVMTSAGSFYTVVVPKAGDDGLCPRYIEFRPRPKAVIPPDVAALQIDIDRALTVLTTLFPDRSESKSRKSLNEARFKEYFMKVAGIAIAGIGQDQTLLGSMALESLRAEVVAREGGRIKNAYVARLGLWAIAFAGLSGTAYLFARYGMLDSWIEAKRNFFVLFAGSAIGTWLSFSIRKTDLKYSELAVIENDQLNPPLRLAFVAGLTLVVGLFFLTGIASITIGTFRTDMNISGSYALLIGLLCGIGELSLSTTVAAKTTEFFSLLAQSGAVLKPPPQPGAGPAQPAVDKDKADTPGDAEPEEHWLAGDEPEPPIKDGAPDASSKVKIPDDYAQKSDAIERAALRGDAGR